MHFNHTIEANLAQFHMIYRLNVLIFVMTLMSVVNVSKTIY